MSASSPVGALFSSTPPTGRTPGMATIQQLVPYRIPGSTRPHVLVWSEGCSLVPDLGPEGDVHPVTGVPSAKAPCRPGRRPDRRVAPPTQVVSSWVSQGVLGSGHGPLSSRQSTPPLQVSGQRAFVSSGSPTLQSVLTRKRIMEYDREG